jgi:hypothetical protein
MNIVDEISSRFEHGHDILFENFPKLPILAVDPLLRKPVVTLRAGEGAAVPELPIGRLRIDHDGIGPRLNGKDVVRA